MTRPARILLVAADDDERRKVHRALQQNSLEVVSAPDYRQAYAELLDSHFDLILTECAPPAEGVEFIKRVRATSQLADILILVVAEWGTGEAALALSQGADGYEPKPFDT